MVAADLKTRQGLKLFGEIRIDESHGVAADLKTRQGLKLQPWTGGEIVELSLQRT